MSRRALLRVLAASAVCIAPLACEGDVSTGPEARLTLSAQGGDSQLGGPGTVLLDPLQVVVQRDGGTEPVAGVTVHWSITQGDGAELGATETVTGPSGLASTTLRLGPQLGEYRVRAVVDDLVGEPATFTARAVQAASITSVTPAQVTAGDTVTIEGEEFSADAAGNIVLFSGLRGVVVESSSTRLRVVVPNCLPTGTTDVRVLLGNVPSNALEIEVEGDGETVSLAVGQALSLADAAAMACLRLPPEPNSRYLIVLQNGADVAGQGLGLRLAAVLADGAVATPSLARPDAFYRAGADHTVAGQGAATLQQVFERGLREEERRAVGADGAIPLAAPSMSTLQAPPPEVGDQREFWVYAGQPGEFERITARVEYVSDHAVLYQDLNAPEGGFTPVEFQQFGELFDDPIHPAMVEAYGAPSDVDDNDRVIILFTPVVNQLTPPGSGGSFVAGFFFGIDLSDLPNSNEAEIFYTLVPDSVGEFGNVRTFEQMMEGVPPVLAHEFQHMIHFNQRVLERGVAQEAPWLAEGLAHTAEELVGDVYLSRGDTDRAFGFKVQNYLRAREYMESPESVGLLDPETPLAVRGASWLLMEYLRQHHGGDALLAQLTQSTVSSVATVTSAVGLPWETILSRWGTSLYVDDLGVPGVDPVYLMPELDLRSVFQSQGYPLVPEMLPFDDFVQTVTLPASGTTYFLVSADADPQQLNVVVSRRAGGPFLPEDVPLFTLVRLQ